MPTFKTIQAAKLQWHDGAPYSAEYDDVFFSSNGGLDETRYVFIEGNDLTARFAQSRQFVIGETGFGSGLNFIATVDAWLQSAPAEARLYYISVEKHPFSREDLSTALDAWPEFNHITTELLEVYPPLVHGFHYRQLMQGRVSLTLLFGDAIELLPDLNATVDAWFLDGFAPAKNQSLWSNDVFQMIAARTASNGSFATFTSAGDVRRGLQAVGFNITKRTGFGKKREMLTGRFQEQKIQVPGLPWFYHTQAPEIEDKHAIVIGAGIAGITTASALARRGWKVTLIDRRSQVAAEASGNPAGVVMPRLTADMSIDARFYLSAYLYTTNWLQHQTGDVGWHSNGVVQLLDTVKQQSLKEIGLPVSVIRFFDEIASSNSVGTVTKGGGVLYSQAGWLQPQQLCKAILQQYSDISFIPSTNIHELKYIDTQWQVFSETAMMASAPIVIVANGTEASRLLPDIDLSLHAVRGQLSYGQSEKTHIKKPVCYDGYIIPLPGDKYCIGASYDRHSNETQLRDKDHQTNIDSLQQALPDTDFQQSFGGRVAFRASTEDHLPLVGPVPNAEYYMQQYADLSHGRPASKYPLAEYQPGLYINSGHGSRGLTSCPLAAEIIASMINDEPVPVSEGIRIALHPGRFMVRELKRNRLVQ